MKAHRGVRAHHACVFSLFQGALEPPAHLIALSQSFLVDLGQLDARRQARVLVVTELRELVFQLEMPT